MAVVANAAQATSRQRISRPPVRKPSGEEGLQDVRIVRALYESAEIGKAVAIPPFVDPGSRPWRRFEMQSEKYRSSAAN